MVLEQCTNRPIEQLKQENKKTPFKRNEQNQQTAKNKCRVEIPGETACISEENWEMGSCLEWRREAEMEETVNSGLARIISDNKEKVHAHMGGNRQRRFMSPQREREFFMM